MNSLKVSDPDGFLYIIADSHLDELIAPADEFVEMLAKLETPQTTVCWVRFIDSALSTLWQMPSYFLRERMCRKR